MNKPQVFISYSHNDKEFAAKIGADLRKNGIETWVDQWEINPGDSIIQKIFSEGLAKSDFFLILLSKSSTESEWVKGELDAAIIRKMEGSTRIIPVILEESDIPVPLKSLKWIELSSNYKKGIEDLVKTIYGVSEKPPIGKVPEKVTSLKNSVGGLSKITSTVGSIFLDFNSEEGNFNSREKSYSATELHSLVPNFSSDELNDAVGELEDYGLVKTFKAMGTFPYDFMRVTPTYALFLHFKNEISSYDPEKDIKEVANAINTKKQIDGKTLNSLLKISPARINRAVNYLTDYGITKVVKAIGTAPYEFMVVLPTRHTRRFVEENCI